jgi:hypothetical protein
MTGGSLPLEGESAFLGRNIGFERAGAILGAQSGLGLRKISG